MDTGAVQGCRNKRSFLKWVQLEGKNGLKFSLTDYELGDFISVLELIHFPLHHWDLSADEESLNSSWSEVMEVLKILLSRLK